MPSRLMSDCCSVPPLRPIRMLVHMVVQLRAYSSVYSSPSSRSTSSSRLRFAYR